MRISVREADTGRAAFERAGGFGVKWAVTVDGLEVPHVITADDEAGYVLCHALDETGNFYLNETKDEVATFEMHGDVVIAATPLN